MRYRKTILSSAAFLLLFVPVAPARALGASIDSGVIVRRLLYCLGIVGFLAGVGLMLPIPASALQSCPTVPNAPTEFQIAETSTFQVTPESYECLAPTDVTFTRRLVDLYDGPFTVVNGVVTSGVVSDEVGFGENLLNLVRVTSDPGETGLLQRLATPADSHVEGALSGGFCGSGFGLETCDGNTFEFGTNSLGQPVFLTVFSDVPGGDVPEPSTVLLLGSALPVDAVFLVWRRRRSS